MTITFSWLVLITVLAAGVAIADGIVRTRGKRNRSILVVVEIVVAALLLLSVFVPSLIGFTRLFTIVLEIDLIALLLFPGTRRRRGAAGAGIALVLNTIVILVAAGWLTVPGLG